MTRLNLIRWAKELRERYIKARMVAAREQVDLAYEQVLAQAAACKDVRL